MNFPQATKSGLRKWITFSGRASRSEYWWFLVFYIAVVMYAHFVNEALDHSGVMKSTTNIPLLLGASALLLVNCVLLVWVAGAMISVFVRRMHDTEHSGWWYWIAFTFIGIFFPLLYWKCTKGTEGANRFGADPLQGDKGNLIQ